MAISTSSLAISTLSVFTSLFLLGCARSPIDAAVSSPAPNQAVAPTTTASAPPTQVSSAPQIVAQNSDEPRSVVDQFYQAYVFQKISWRQLQSYIDPDTYQQMSQFKGYDSDPFAATQERVFDYLIEDSRVTGNTAEVEIRFKTGSRAPMPNFGRAITVVLQNNAGQWQIKNMIYGTDSTGKPDDLLHGWMESQKYLIINQR